MAIKTISRGSTPDSLPPPSQTTQPPLSMVEKIQILVTPLLIGASIGFLSLLFLPGAPLVVPLLIGVGSGVITLICIVASRCFPSKRVDQAPPISCLPLSTPTQTPNHINTVQNKARLDIAIKDKICRLEDDNNRIANSKQDLLKLKSKGVQLKEKLAINRNFSPNELNGCRNTFKGFKIYFSMLRQAEKGLDDLRQGADKAINPLFDDLNIEPTPELLELMKKNEELKADYSNLCNKIEGDFQEIEQLLAEYPTNPSS